MSSYSAIAGVGAGAFRGVGAGTTADGTGAVDIGVLRVDRAAPVLHESTRKRAQKNLQHRCVAVDLHGEPNAMRILPRLTSVAAALACFTATVAALPASAAPGPDQPADSDPDHALEPLALSIAGPETDPELAGLLEAPVAAVLRERGYRVYPSAERGIFLVVSIDETAADTHEIEVRLERDGFTEFYPTTRCVRCGSTDLVETIERTLEPALEVLDAGGPHPPEPEPDAADPIGSETSHLDRDETHDPNRRIVETPSPPPGSDRTRLGTKGIAGVALLSTGLAATVTGAALWGSKSADHPTRPDLYLRLKPPGITMVALGGAATVSGVILVVLDRKQARSRKTAAAPMLGPGLAGVSLSGRF